MGKNGQLQNIVLVKKADGRYECIIGNGRLEAAKKLGWEKIRADVKEGVSQADKLLMTLAENSEREDVSPFYTAKLYQMVMEAAQIGEAALAERLGKDPGDVNRCLALMSLAPEVQTNLERSKLSMSHLREIQRLRTPDEQLKMVEACEKEEWSSRTLKSKVDKVLAGPKPEGHEAPEAGNKPPFQFSWKGSDLVIKARYASDSGKPIETYLRELGEAIEQAVHAKSQKAQPQEEAPKAVAQAA
jgi:ParB/RepB/Spo0J family partition protein